MAARGGAAAASATTAGAAATVGLLKTGVGSAAGALISAGWEAARATAGIATVFAAAAGGAFRSSAWKSPAWAVECRSHSLARLDLPCSRRSCRPTGDGAASPGPNAESTRFHSGASSAAVEAFAITGYCTVARPRHRMTSHLCMIDFPSVPVLPQAAPLSVPRAITPRPRIRTAGTNAVLLSNLCQPYRGRTCSGLGRKRLAIVGAARASSDRRNSPVAVTSTAASAGSATEAWVSGMGALNNRPWFAKIYQCDRIRPK